MTLMIYQNDGRGVVMPMETWGTLMDSSFMERAGEMDQICSHAKISNLEANRGGLFDK